MNIETERILLVPATAHHIKTELKDIKLLSGLLNCQIPGNWPPEELKDAIPYFLSTIEDKPACIDWLYRYCILKDNGSSELIGSIGFLNMPDENGTVETGYSILPQYQGNGYATEMLNAIVEWALENGAEKIIARSDMDNVKSQKVLVKAGFIKCDELFEEKKFLYEYKNFL